MGRRRKKREFVTSARPSIPITCEIALAFVVGIFASSYLFRMLEEHFTLKFVVLVISAVVILFVLVLKRRTKGLPWIVLFVLFGVLIGCLNLFLLHQSRECAPNTYEMLEFETCEDSRASNYGSQVIAQITSGSQSGKKVLLFFNSDESLLVGQCIKAETRLAPPNDDYIEYYDNKGMVYSARISEFEILRDESLFKFIQELRLRLLNILGSGSDEQTMLRAVLLGERSSLFDAEFYRDIKVVGLAHLVAVSGAHLVIVTGFVTLVLRRFHLKAKLSVAIQALFLLVYLALVGFPLSCIRAAIMSAITLFALLAKRRSSALSALGLATLAMTLFDPSVVHQLSFQLSVASTLGIVLFMPLINGWLEKLFNKMPEFIRETLAMTLSALIFSLPISAAQFSTVPLLSPVANVLATPYLTLLLLFGFAALLVSSITPFALEILSYLTKGLLVLFSSLASIPGASMPVSWDIQIALLVTGLLALVLWILWPMPRLFSTRSLCFAGLSIFVCAAAVFSLSVTNTGEKVTMLNVGQGDAFALTSEGRTLLIDTGNQPEMLYAALARNGIGSIDAALITHPDDDHCGSLKALQGVVAANKVIVAEGIIENEGDNAKRFVAQASEIVGNDGIYEVSTGDSIRFGKFFLEVVSPDSVAHDGGNEDSICFYANYDGDLDGNVDWSGFFCGDAESEVLESLNEQGVLHQVDLYKVGHHGSKKSITQELAGVLSPKVALIGVGKNSYGHPREEIIGYLEDVNARVHRSDVCGDTVVSLYPDHVEISCEHE